MKTFDIRKHCIVNNLKLEVSIKLCRIIFYGIYHVSTNNNISELALLAAYSFEHNQNSDEYACVNA